MSLLLDSNALVWWLTDDPRLARNETRARIMAEPRVAVSLVSPWELWIKQATGRLSLPSGFDRDLEKADGIHVLAPTLEDARLAASLPLLHRDPFDRMIIAQALNRQMTVVTSDRVFAEYGAQTVLV